MHQGMPCLHPFKSLGLTFWTSTLPLLSSSQAHCHSHSHCCIPPCPRLQALLQPSALRAVPTSPPYTLTVTHTQTVP